MDKAKAAVSDFLGKAGHHHTTVDESANAAVTNEHVKPTRHENVQKAVDKETHQDHYHTTVQPVQHKEVLPEKHHHQMTDVEHRHFEHDKPDEVKARLEKERAQFANTSTTHETHHTQKTHPTVGGEHIHHHVHETVQPVIHKETVQPEVVHTTVPIHETHHNAARHHGTQTLPTMTMDEFKKAGGSLTGNETRHTEREGCPDPSNPAGFAGLGGNSNHHAGFDHRGRDSPDGLTSGTSTTGRTGDSTLGNGVSRTEVDLGHRGHGTNPGAVSGTTNTTGGTTGGNYVGTGNPLGSTTHRDTNDTTATTGKKPSLMDRLNPKKDTDGDGKRGVLD